MLFSVPRINFGGEGSPQNWTSGHKMWNLWTSPSLTNPPTKTSFLAHFVAESPLFGRFGMCVSALHPLPPPGYGPDDNLIQNVVFLSHYPIQPAYALMQVADLKFIFFPKKFKKKKKKPTVPILGLLYSFWCILYAESKCGDENFWRWKISASPLHWMSVWRRLIHVLCFYPGYRMSHYSTS